ncbi:MAG: hypothetical protein D6797_09030 [Bdellovibrio sp.]|nr:MAG: hypothetical protein D6797_09030 [Bdellovibrio sp.]
MIKTKFFYSLLLALFLATSLAASECTTDDCQSKKPLTESSTAAKIPGNCCQKTADSSPINKSRRQTVDQVNSLTGDINNENSKNSPGSK